MIRFDGIVGDGPNGTQVRAYDPHDVTVLIDGKWIKIKTNCPEDDFIIRNEADIEAIADALLQRLQDGAFRLSGFRALRYYPPDGPVVATEAINNRASFPFLDRLLTKCDTHQEGSEQSESSESPQ